MRTLMYDSRFKVNEETTKALAWVSFPNLLPTYFDKKKCLLSLAPAVGKLMQLDLARINKTRPSCAMIKFLVDLKGDFPKSITMVTHLFFLKHKKTANFSDSCKTYSLSFTHTQRKIKVVVQIICFPVKPGYGITEKRLEQRDL